MLRWSARETNRSVDIRGLVDDEVDTLIEGGRELVSLGSAVGGSEVDASSALAVAGELGPDAASDAVAVAANFEIMNRVVDGIGLPFGRGRAAQMAEDRAILGVDRFPHAGH